MAAGAVVLLAPTILATGLPLFSSDATVARAGLAGASIQFVRVAIPGLAAVLLLESLADRPAFGRPVATWLVIGVLVAFMISLASRYLVIELLATLTLGWLLTGRTVDLRIAAFAVVIGLAGFVAIGVLRAPQDFATGTGDGRRRAYGQPALPRPASDTRTPSKRRSRPSSPFSSA